MHERVAVARVLGKHVAAASHVYGDVVDVELTHVFQRQAQRCALAFEKDELWAVRAAGRAGRGRATVDRAAVLQALMH